MEPPRIGGFLVGDGHEDLGDPRGEPFHEETDGLAGRVAGIVEPEAVAGIGDPRYPRPPRGHAGDEAAQRHMGMHQIGFFRSEQRHQCLEGAPVGERRDLALQRQTDDAEALGPGDLQQRAFGAGADHLMSPVPRGPHQREEELAEGEVDVGDFDDFHATVRVGFNPTISGPLDRDDRVKPDHGGVSDNPLIRPC